MAYFRPHATPEPSNWKVIAFGVLLGLDIYLLALIASQVIRMVR